MAWKSNHIPYFSVWYGYPSLISTVYWLGVMENMAWKSNHMYCFPCNTNTHLCPNFNDGWVEPPLILGQAWVITSCLSMWLRLLIDDLFPHLLSWSLSVIEALGERKGGHMVDMPWVWCSIIHALWRSMAFRYKSCRCNAASLRIPFCYWSKSFDII